MQNQSLPYEEYERTPEEWYENQPGGHARGEGACPGNAYGYRGAEEFRPLTPWAYLGYGLLFSVPLIGLIALVYYSLNDSNINRRSFARSYWCMLLVMLALWLLLNASGFIGAGILPLL